MKKTENDYRKIAEQKDRVIRLSNRMKNESMDDGSLAYCNDKELESNPYPENHLLYQYWTDGWNEEKYLQEQEK